MRPVRLELEGFTSFPKRVEIDFGQLDLFAITGPTGAGKTSILDAMLYALYGQTPRIGPTEVPRLVSLGMNTVRVSLQFRSGGKLYRITRTRKAGKTSVTNILFEEQIGQDEWNPLSGGVKEIAEKVREVLGLDFDGFTRSVTLPQGAFDKFLRGEAKERTEILKDLLGLRVYERMMKAANERDKELRLKAEMQEQQLSTSYADATEENLRAHREQLAELGGQLTAQQAEQTRLNGLLPLATELKHVRGEAFTAAADLAKARKDLQTAVEQAASTERLLAECTRRLTEIELALQATGYDEAAWAGLMQAVPLVRQQGKLQEDLVTRRKDRQTRAASQPALETSAQASAERLTASRNALEEAKQIASQATNAYERFQQLHGSADLIQAASRDLASASKAIAGLPPEDQLTNAVAQAEAALEHLQTMHAAHEIRRHLQPGDACPVCERPIANMPDTSALSPAPEAKALLKQATAAHEKWRLAKAQQAKAQARADSVTQRAETSIHDLEALVQQSAVLSGQAPAASSALQAAQRAETQAASAAQDANQQLHLLLQQLANMDAEIRKSQDKLREAAAALQAFPAWAPLPPSELEAALEEQNTAKQRRARLEQQRLDAMKKQQQATLEGSELKSRQLSAQNRISEKESQIQSAKTREADLAVTLRASGIDEAVSVESGLRTVTAVLATLHANIARADERMKDIRRRMEESRILRIGIQQKREQAAVYHSLGKLLAADEFIAYVQREALIGLAAAASGQLDMLSRGQFRLTLGPDRNEFFVIDQWNGSETRSVKTLSGGESFLASLALALALSEGLAGYSDERARSRLDSLFIDEGISSLDPESLEVAIGAIETLSSGSRMVGVISHVAELGERLPARIRVEKAPGGSSVTVEGGHSHSMVAGGL